jgi:hypothetical protein
LKSSAGSVVRLLEARKIFNMGSIREKTPSVTGGMQEKAARGRIIALDSEVKPRDLWAID